MRWEKLQLQGSHGHVHAEGAQGLAVRETSGPGMRWGHTCNAIKGGRFLYVFGGYGKDNCQTNQVHVFDTVTQTWSQPLIKGTPPIPRDSHSCTTVGDNLFVFGGTDGMNPLKDLHILDTSSHTWISPTIRGEGPEAREGHSAALVGKRLFIFGGGGKSSENNTEIYFNDLYILNTETFVWKCAATSGTPPSPRDSHSCSSWKNKIFVIGGEDKHDYYLSDVHILDTDTLIWRELNTSGQILPPRAGHSTVAFGKNLFVFSGFTDAQNLYNDLYMLDVDSGLWTKVATTGDGPSARFSVAGDCLDPTKSGVLVFIGGCNKNLEALDDMYYLHTGLARESQQRLEKLSLRKQLKLKCQEQSLNPAKALVTHNMGSDINQPLPLVGCNQGCRQNMPLSQPIPPGKKTFQAKVTESTPEGLTIETVIDGKPLRGILFLNKPSSFVPAIYNSSRKRAAGEASGTVSNGVPSGKLKPSKVLKQDGIEDRLADIVQGSNLGSQELQTRAVTDLNSNAAATSDASHLLKVSSSEKTPVASLNPVDHKNDASLSTSVNPKDNKPNNFINSGSEGLRDHQSGNTQMCNTEVLKPTSVKSPVYSSPNQDSSRVICSDPVKST